MINYILCDLEGCMTSSKFVYDTLFPYFINNVDDLFDNTHPDSVANALNALRKELESEGMASEPEDVAAYLISLTRKDIKHPALKYLQAVVWENGYLSGKIKAHLYEDVPPALDAWKKGGKLMGVYSAGSISAQKQIFKHSVYGDLNKYFTHYFDLRYGQKKSASAYTKIAEMLYVSDNENELNAASEAGMKTLQVVRENVVLSLQHEAVPSFSKVKI